MSRENHHETEQNIMSKYGNRETIRTQSMQDKNISQDEKALKKSPWIHAWSDPVAGVNTLPGCMKLVDMEDDGDHKLVVADCVNRKLKIYKGTNLHFEKGIADIPCAVEFFYSSTKKPAIPYIAVACGSCIYIYHKYTANYQFSLPEVPMDEQEKQIWKQLHSQEITLPNAVKMLQTLRVDRHELSPLSQTFLTSSGEGQKKLIDSTKDTGLQQMNFVTCLSKIQKSIEEDKSPSQLVVGTENKRVMVLDPTGRKIISEVQLESAPMQIITDGLFEGDNKFTVLCRNGKVYEIKKSINMGAMVDLPSKAMAIVKLDRVLAVGCMDNSIHGFFMKGKKAFSFYMTHQIVAMELMQMKYVQQIRALLVALSNGEIRLYNEKNLIYTIKSDEPASGLIFGYYGREEGSLVTNYRSGGITIRVLQRLAKLTVPSFKAGPPPEQDIPLNIPKKTKLFIELAQRERDQYASMHKLFHMDLAKIKLKCAQNYLRIISEGNAPLSYASGANIKLTAAVIGLGPVFHIDVCITNLGKTPLFSLMLILNYNEKLYFVRKLENMIPILFPSVEYIAGCDIESVDPTGAADALKVFVSSRDNCVPMVSAYINMPIFEPSLANY